MRPVEARLGWPDYLRAVAALSLVVVFVVQTAFFGGLLWRDRELISLSDLLSASMCGVPISR